jgi:phenylpropionate dioxygenase-like ring-hydroxylating dioxygenase large terminal subunit
MSSGRTRPKLPLTPLERAPAPDLGHAPIAKQRYVSREWADLERLHVWPRVWLLAGLASDVASPGDYSTCEIGRESVLIVRQADGGLAAFHNVCLHRGNRLVEPGRGHVRRFTCLFHAWRYGIDGRLEAALDPETFPQGCPTDALSLRPVRCEIWGGFVWVNLDPEAEPLAEFLGVVPAHLDPYHFEQMKLMNDFTIEIECNWKTSMDAFHEAYHIYGTHPDTLDVNDDVDVQLDCYERHSRMLLKLGVASPRHSGYGTVTATIRNHFLASAGIDGQAFAGSAEDVRPAIARAVREVQGPAMGIDFSELRDEQLVDDFHYSVFPNVTFNIFGRSAWVFRHRPHPTDPDRMYFDFWNLVRLPNADVPRPAHQFHVNRDDLVLDVLGGGGGLLAQDTFNLPRIQRGMHSAGFSGLHLGDQEIRIRHFHSVLDRYIPAAGRFAAERV